MEFVPSAKNARMETQNNGREQTFGIFSKTDLKLLKDRERICKLKQPVKQKLVSAPRDDRKDLHETNRLM